MKLRVIYNRRREVVELSGDDITLGDLRTAVCRRFGLATSGFDVSLNGQDVLTDDSESLALLGVVSGDLVYILQNTAEPMNALTSQDSASVSRSSSNASDPQVQHVQAQEMGEVDHPERSSVTITDQPVNPTLEHRKTHETQQLPVHQQAGPSNIWRNRALLCREGIPDVLEDLYKAMEVGTIHKAVWIVIHVLMLETGYLCASEDNSSDEESHDLSRILPQADWEKGSVTRINYSHPSCPGLTCSLTCTSLGPYIMVHGLADSVQNSEVYQCRLQPTDFVRGNVDLKTSGASSVYYNLHRLSRLIKDQVAYPLLSFMRGALGLRQLCGLMALPTEVKLIILRNLPVRCVMNVSCTCHELRSLSNDSSLWEHFVVRDFGQRAKEQHRSWKVEYIKLYKHKKTQEQMQSQMILPPLFPPGTELLNRGGYSDYFPNLPFVPGGEYPPPGFAPPGLPRPRFDPFGPLPDNNLMPGPSRRGRRPGRPGRPGYFPPRFF